MEDLLLIIGFKWEMARHPTLAMEVPMNQHGWKINSCSNFDLKLYFHRYELSAEQNHLMWELRVIQHTTIPAATNLSRATPSPSWHGVHENHDSQLCMTARTGQQYLRDCLSVPTIVQIKLERHLQLWPVS